MTQYASLPSTIKYHIKKRKNHARLMADTLLIMLIYWVASEFSHRQLGQMDGLIMLGIVMGWYFSSKVTNLYNDFRTVYFIDELLALIPNLIVLFLTISVVFFLTNEDNYARTFTVMYLSLLALTISLKMYFVRKLLMHWHAKGINQKKLVIVGEYNSLAGFLQLVNDNPQFGYQVVGTKSHSSLNENLAIDTLSFLNEIAYTEVIDEMVIALEQFNEKYVRILIEWADKKGILVRFTPGFFQFSASRYSLELFGNYPLITVRDTPLELNYWWLLKRGFDILFSVLFLILIASWLFPLIALAIVIDSKGPAFFIQGRWGQKGKNIKVWKFRTMYKESLKSNGNGAFHQTTKDDSRITRLGHFLRRTNLDELPQFINVLCGSMSLVGPRPHAIKHSQETLPLIDNYMIRHRIKPGITGWAQVNGFRGETKEIDQMRKRVDYDIWYIENWSVVLDFEIIIRTAYNMLKGDPKAY